MPLTAAMRRPNLRTGRTEALVGVLLVAGLVLVLVGYEIVAGRRPAVVIQVRSLSAEGIGFDPGSATAPALTHVGLSFINVSNLDHNLVFLDPLDARTSAIVAPGESATIEFKTPATGEYAFVCTIHEGMRGSLIVQ